MLSDRLECQANVFLYYPLDLLKIFFWRGASYSAIHKAAGLTVPGHSMILPGTISETPISHEWSPQLERPQVVVPTAGQRLCE